MKKLSLEEKLGLLRLFFLLLPFLILFGYLLYSCAEAKLEQNAREAQWARERIQRQMEEEEAKKKREEYLQWLADLPEEPPETISIPYVGMPEKWVDKTKLGKHGHFHDGTTAFSGHVYESHTYSFWKNDAIIFSVTFKDGLATEVRDYRDDPIQRVHYTPPKNGNPYSDAEDFYEDYEDEFEDYDEAEEAYYEEYGGR